MSIFDTNIIERSLTLSSYTILPGVGTKVAYYEYSNIFKNDVCYKSGEYIGIKGVIEKIGEMPIDYLSEFNHGNNQPILKFLKYYTVRDVQISVMKERNKFKFKFIKRRIGDYYSCDDVCVINVYTR